MKTRFAALGFVVALALAYSLAWADTDKQVTLTGDMVCGKCTLKTSSACSNVLMVKEGDKTINYNVTFTDNDKSHHVCSGKKHVQVTGTLTESNGQKTIAASKVEEVH